MKTIVGLLLFVTVIAHAQDSTNSVPQNAPPALPDTGKAMQKIVVTGSYIRRTVDQDNPSPVTQIDNTKAQESGSYTVGGMLNDNAVTSSGGETVSFHGQSSANNLVLLNGLRLPKAAGGDTVDISFIPASAIERAEVLKDGASALYGSEALAGVVNIITKRDYDGANAFIRYSSPEKNFRQETTFVGTYGKQWGKTNFLGVFQYARTENLFYRDTQFGMKDVQQNGSLASDQANIIDLGNSNKKYTATTCPPDRLTSRGECRYNFYDTLQFDPAKSNYNLLLSSGTDFGKGFRLETALVYTLANARISNTPPITEFEDYSNSGGPNWAIPKATADAWAPSVKDGAGVTPGSFTGPIKLQYSPDEEIGPRLSESNTNTGVAQVRLAKETDDFDWEVSVGYGITDRKNTTFSGNANKQMLFDMINAGQFNPYKPAGQKDDLSSAFVETWFKNTASIINPKAIVSGKAFNLGSKPVFAALGYENQYQNYKFTNDALSSQGLPLTGLFTPQSGSRNVNSAFLEFTHHPISTLQLQLAGRFDRYSDFGSTINPKVAAAYKFSDKVTGRASYGTGFKAPDLSAIYQGSITRPQRFRDAVACANPAIAAAGCSNLFTTTSYGNSNLDAELGEHYNFGIQIRPTKKVQVNLDHWRAYGTNSLQELNLSDLTNAELQLGATDPVFDNLGVDIVRNADGTIQSVRYPVKVNSGKYKVYGIDFDITYKTPMASALGTMNLILKMDHSHNLATTRQDFSFVPLRRNFNLAWKNVASVGLAQGNHLSSFRMRSFGAADKDTSPRSGVGVGSIPQYQEFDLHYEYYGFAGGVVTAGVRNMFDRVLHTEFNRGADGFLLPANVTATGRAFYVSYSQDF
ncbi:MAG: TonB-dependent receptor [Bdellovibrionales bacterium]|nr:TonB-dependent receptor [Bdellovibrionales bacterium]